MKIDFINLKAQYQAYKNEIDARLQGVLDSCAFVLGSEVAQAEKNLASFCGVKHAHACSSGTTALLLALMALDVKAGDEVITTPFTFIATAEMIALLGAKPVFVDICESSYNIDVAQIESKITPRTKAIIPVSLYGQPADMDEINAIAQKHGVAVIEDACQSFGAKYKLKRSCNLSTIGVTSFFPSKPLGAYGDGGAVFCNDDELSFKVASLLNHGQIERYVHKFVGLNARLDSMQCAVINVKLAHFENELKIREQKAKVYDEGLKGLILPQVPNDRSSAWAQYSVRASGAGGVGGAGGKKMARDEILAKLNERGIPTAVHYPIPLHLQESMSHLGHKKGDFAVSEKVSDEVFSLPFSAFLEDDSQKYIIENLNEILGV